MIQKVFIFVITILNRVQSRKTNWLIIWNYFDMAYHIFYEDGDYFFYNTIKYLNIVINVNYMLSFIEKIK